MVKVFLMEPKNDISTFAGMINSPILILIRPQMGENIGAVARAMANFGLSRLRIVAPRDGWPNPHAHAMATNAAPILEQASLYDTVAEALADIQHAYATTARPRDMEKPVVTPAEAIREINMFKDNESAAYSADKVAIMFGPERTGLTNEDLVLCHRIITIPTSEHASLNVAQSAVVVAYEWWQAQQQAGTPHSVKGAVPLANLADTQHFLTMLEDTLTRSDFFKVPEKKAGMMQNIAAMFTRAGLTEQELRTLYGMVRALAGKR